MRRQGAEAGTGSAGRSALGGRGSTRTVSFQSKEVSGAQNSLFLFCSVEGVVSMARSATTEWDRKSTHQGRISAGNG